MEQLTKEVQRKLATKLQQSRLRLLETQPFYGLLLLHMKFSLDVAAGTAYTDGERIAFDPSFLESLSDSEVDFVLCHELLHTALSHTLRGKDFEDKEAFNIATDIVVNSNILFSNGMNLDSITLSDTGESMHNLPDGREGFDYAAEEIYPIIIELQKKKMLKYENLTSKRKRRGHVNIPPKGKSIVETTNGQPWDNHGKWDEKQQKGKGQSSSKGKCEGKDGNPESNSGSADEMKELWLKRMVDATELINSMSVCMPESSIGRGKVPAFMERLLKDLRKSKVDWRTMLNNFVQEEIMDYSFTPPDRRFTDGDFFLPDFNEKDDSVKNVLFMIDTSGSISDEMLVDAFSEIKGAIDQFNGKLCGWLGFFDAAVYEPLPFEDVDELLDIKPRGGGGTDFGIIFDYVEKKMDEPPASIVILTDGYAPIPKEEAANGVPVLWLINNDDITPEWGKIARITPTGQE